jgi:hypothetical protein
MSNVGSTDGGVGAIAGLARAEISINIRAVGNMNLRCQVAQDSTCRLGSGPGPGVVEGGGAASFFFCLRAPRWGTERQAGLAGGGSSGGMGGSGGGGSAGGPPGAPGGGFLQNR